MNPEVENEAAFIQALGFNPGIVAKDSVKINMVGGKAIVEMRVIVPVDYDVLAKAFLAASPDEEKPDD